MYCYTCFTTLYGNACYSVPFTSGPNGVIYNVLVFLQLITSEYCNIHYYIPLLIADKVPLDSPIGQFLIGSATSGPGHSSELKEISVTWQLASPLANL